MVLALSPAEQHALTIQTQQLLTLLLSGAPVLRGRVTAWLLGISQLVQTDEQRAAQHARLAAARPSPRPRAPRRARPAAARK
jgi:hypothetical protein